MAKTFKDQINPAMQFISTPEESAPAPDRPESKATQKPPKGYKRNPAFIETRSKRLQLLVQPSLYDRLKETATEQSTSVNDLIHSILKEAMGMGEE